MRGSSSSSSRSDSSARRRRKRRTLFGAAMQVMSGSVCQTGAGVTLISGICVPSAGGRSLKEHNKLPAGPAAIITSGRARRAPRIDHHNALPLIIFPWSRRHCVARNERPQCRLAGQ